MPKKSKKQYSKRAQRVQYYKWEFLRRNKNYEKELKCFYNNEDPMLIAGIENKKIRQKKMKKYIKISKAFAKKWGLFFHFLPEYPIPEEDLEQIAMFGHETMMFPYATEPSFFDVQVSANDEFVKRNNFDDEENYKKWISFHKPIKLDRINIDIDLSRSKTNILHEVGKIITSIKRVRKRKGLKDEKKPNLDLFKDYLKIYDLRINKQMSYVKIAQKLYSKKFNKEFKLTEAKGKVIKDKEKIYREAIRNTGDVYLSYNKAYGNEYKSSNKVVQLVIDRFNAAKKMIEGGYKDIW